MDGMLIQVVLFATLGSCVLGFVKLLKKVKERQYSRAKALVLYLLYSFLPVTAFVLLFLGLVGLEELTHKAIIGELLARSLVLVVAIGISIAVLSNLVFLVFVVTARIAPKQELP